MRMKWVLELSGYGRVPNTTDKTQKMTFYDSQWLNTLLRLSNMMSEREQKLNKYSIYLTIMGFFPLFTNHMKQISQIFYTNIFKFDIF